MRHSCRLLLATLCLALLTLLAGCGGGGGGGGADTAATAWTAYDPPAAVVMPAARQSFMTNQAFEVLRAVKAVPEDQWLFPNGSIPAIPHFISSVLLGDIEQVAGGIISLGPLAAKPKSVGLGTLEVLRLVATQKQRAVSPAQGSSGVNVDTTDSSGIHWTGTVQRGTTSITGNVHGVGPSTDVTITVTVAAKVNLPAVAITGATLTATIDGTCLANVAALDWSTGARSVTPGQATVHATLSADATLGASDGSTGTFTASTDMSADFRVNEGGSGVLKDRQEMNQSASGNWNTSAVTLQYTGTQYDGATVVDNGVERLFWGKHALDGNASISLPGASITGTLTDHLTLSNGITGVFTFDFASGVGTATVSGTIHDKDGVTVLATIGGTLDASAAAPQRVSICWNGGAPEVQDWLY